MGERRAADYLAFFRAVEPFKDVLRNSWTAQGRRESAAEHSWRLCLMAVALEDELGERGPCEAAWFDRGLNWTYGFHHAEAIACFRRAAEADPDCAMAWWGIAYATGPNYNLTWDLMDAPTRAAVLSEARAATEAALAAPGASPAERALIDALTARYPQATPLDDMSAWNDAFADAMRGCTPRTPATSTSPRFSSRR
jgi:hypothetical protein